MFKKKNIFKLTAALLLGFVLVTGMSLETKAAPKQMADGNLFDPVFYATTYPDVAAVLGTDEGILYNHYVLCGSKEGRLPFAPDAGVQTAPPQAVGPKVMADGNLFDPVFYATTSPDVAAVLGTDEGILYNHYVLCGSKEGRLPFAPDASAQTAPPQAAGPKVMADGNLFDPVFYATTYPDVAAVLGTDEGILYQHYVNVGSKEGRFPYQLSQKEIRNRELHNKIMALQQIYPQGMYVLDSFQGIPCG